MSVFPYGLFAAAGVGCMLIAMLLTAPKRSFSKGTVTVFGLLAIPLSLVFSRLLYCVFQLNLFCDIYENPWFMLCIWDGGYSIWGVIPALLLAAWLTAKMQRCSFSSLWDCVSLSSALLFAMLYAGEGRTELGIGKVIDAGFLTSAFPFLVLEQKLGVNVEYRLIVYRLQCLACVVLFLVMLLSRRKSKAEGILALRSRILSEIDPGLQDRQCDPVPPQYSERGAAAGAVRVPALPDPHGDGSAAHDPAG